MRIEDAKNAYDARKDELSAVQKQLQAVKDDTQAVAFQVSKLEEENEVLGAQIVSSPERIQGELPKWKKIFGACDRATGK